MACMLLEVEGEGEGEKKKTIGKPKKYESEKKKLTVIKKY